MAITCQPGQRAPVSLRCTHDPSGLKATVFTGHSQGRHSYQVYSQTTAHVSTKGFLWCNMEGGGDPLPSPFSAVPGRSMMASASSKIVAKVSSRSTIVAFADAFSHLPNSSNSSCVFQIQLSWHQGTHCQASSCIYAGAAGRAREASTFPAGASLTGLCRTFRASVSWALIQVLWNSGFSTWASKA